ncbi:MAG: hypothetical protein US33_C0001G0001, partial [Parcubacteria group bacterium GW2011_GWC1_36_9]
TIIETMIAISIFLVIVMVGMGALLNANFIHQKSQDMRSIMDSLSFVMEDMSKNLRTGYNYRCYIDLDDITDDPSISSTRNCNDGGSGIAFEHQNGRLYINPPDNMNYYDEDQWAYYIDNGTIFKSEEGAESGTFVQLTPKEVDINISYSNFLVLGAEKGDSDSQQPFVTIKLVGEIDSKGVKTPFSLQTSVSQRMIDI